MEMQKSKDGKFLPIDLLRTGNGNEKVNMVLSSNFTLTLNRFIILIFYLNPLINKNNINK